MRRGRSLYDGGVARNRVIEVPGAGLVDFVAATLGIDRDSLLLGPIDARGLSVRIVYCRPGYLVAAQVILTAPAPGDWRATLEWAEDGKNRRSRIRFIGDPIMWGGRPTTEPTK